jgi:hypothetical protein
MTEVTDRVVRRTFLVLLELLLSLLMAGMVLLFPVAHAITYACFLGQCSEPGTDEIRSYWTMAAVFVTVAILVFVVARRRGAGAAYVWHGLVTLVGLASAIIFQIPTVDWADLLREDSPPPSSPNVPCHSGSNDCPGG